MAQSKEIIQSLQTLVDQFVLNDVRIDEIPEKDDNPGHRMYWHYYEVKNGNPSGYGFSSPNFDDFVNDVLTEIKLNIEATRERKKELHKQFVENIG